MVGQLPIKHMSRSDIVSRNFSIVIVAIRNRFSGVPFTLLTRSPPAGKHLSNGGHISDRTVRELSKCNMHFRCRKSFPRKKKKKGDVMGRNSLHKLRLIINRNIIYIYLLAAFITVLCATAFWRLHGPTMPRAKCK